MNYFLRWLPHRHDWEKWQTISTENITRGNTNAVVGKVLLQQRVCKECGYVKINLQKVSI
jgi:hypothetical protein